MLRHDNTAAAHLFPVDVRRSIRKGWAAKSATNNWHLATFEHRGGYRVVDGDVAALAGRPCQRALDPGCARSPVAAERALGDAAAAQPGDRRTQHPAQIAHPAVQAGQTAVADRPTRVRSRWARRNRKLRQE